MSTQKLKVLRKPLTLRSLKRIAKNGRIDVVIEVDLSTLIDLNLEDLNDFCDEAILNLDSIVGSLSDINYRIRGSKPGGSRSSGRLTDGTLFLGVNADVSDIINGEV
jgi:hypothetical protein